MTRGKSEQQPHAANGMSFIAELEAKSLSHGGAGRSVYSVLITDEACEEFWRKYAADLKINAACNPDSTCVEFARRCQDAWLDVFRNRSAKEDARDWDKIVGAFEHALTALTEAGPEFEKAIEVFGQRDKRGRGLRDQLERAKEAGITMRDHLMSVSAGPRTQARRFAYALARSCEAAPAIPRPSLAQICTLVRLLYDQCITPQEVGSAIRG